MEDLKSQQESRCLFCSGMMPTPYVRFHVSGNAGDAFKRCRKAVNKKSNFPQGGRGMLNPAGKEFYQSWPCIMEG